MFGALEHLSQRNIRIRLKGLVVVVASLSTTLGIEVAKGMR